MAEFLVWANEDKPGLGIKKGDVAEVRANGAPYAAGEGLPDFVIIKIPELLLSQIEEYQKPWILEIDYEIVAHNVALDGYRVKATSTRADSTGKGELTRAQVENYLARWNATVYSAATNEVVFDIGIFNAVKSSIFWDKRQDIENVIFTESYNNITGIHEITADYSALGINPSYVERYVREKADSIISHAGQVIVFSMDRDNVFNAFKDDVNQILKSIIIEKRIYYFSQAVVDFAINEGGTITAGLDELNQNIKSKLDD